MSKEALPFLTITQNLTTNRCWLCEQTFPRGLTKKVFQIQHLLEYFQQRYKQECESSSSNAEATSSPEGEATQSSCPPIKTKNFSDCYQRYKNEMDTYGNIENLLKELIENDLDVWMSGLICALHGGCAADASLFIQGMDSTASTGAKKKAGIPAGITFANCPPDCGCDNPWAFLSA